MKEMLLICCTAAIMISGFHLMNKLDAFLEHLDIRPDEERDEK